jgi:hypothetical protein
MNAGKESPQYFQLISLAALHIIAPTITKVHPVAHGGIDAKIGAKKMEMKKQIPVVIAVRPVFPPSEIPAPDSMNAVTGESPKRDPMEIPKAKHQLAGILKHFTQVCTYHQPNMLSQILRNLGSLRR